MPDVPIRPTVPADAAAFRSAILDWYDARGRSLPFRGTKDPYAVLVSETMAQQTQIGRVGPAWESFVARFPTFEALAAASPADVLREWRGLGYNRRALNLQRTARAVVEDRGGSLPRDVRELERLPGIGPYTARAVAALAFDQPVGAVDTNVRRVLGRVAMGDPAALTPAELQGLADALVTQSRAADWTHALMDVGATHCRPSAPRCDGCPAASWCAYRSSPRPPGNGQATPRRPGLREAGFERTARWLRGRIVDRARAADGDGWMPFREPLGAHGVADVVAMLAVLEREGLLERHPLDPAMARLPQRSGRR